MGGSIAYEGLSAIKTPEDQTLRAALGTFPASPLFSTGWLQYGVAEHLPRGRVSTLTLTSSVFGADRPALGTITNCGVPKWKLSLGAFGPKSTLTISDSENRNLLAPNARPSTKR